MRKGLVLVIAAFASTWLLATDYFVNGDGGVDDATEGRGRSDEMPYQTIAFALGKAKTRDDRVFVAEGTYFERNLAIAAGVGLIATGRRDFTAIDANASADDTARCIASMAAKSYVKGFTIKNGWVPMDAEHGGGVKADRNAAIIDCAIRNCHGYRGGGGNGGTWIRCYFASDNAAGFHACASGVYGPGVVANCVFDGAGCLTDSVNYTTVMNCTFCNGGYVGTNGSAYPRIYNSIVQGVLNGARVYRSVMFELPSESSSLKDSGDGCLFYPAINQDSPSIARDAGFIPLPTATDLLGKGNWDNYETSFPADWKEIGEWLKAYGGGPRKAGGAIDIGAAEYSAWIENGLRITTEDVGEGRTRLSISQDPAGERYISGFTFDGEAVSLDVNRPGWTWSKILADNPANHAFVPVYAYENCCYVDCSRPNDDDTGVGRFHAVKTIQAAMGKVTAGGTIRVMPGTYSYRDSQTPDGNGVLNVVHFTKPNVTLESVRGAKLTVIEGNPVNDVGGVRCVNAAQAGSVVRGFTLKNGGTSGGNGPGNGAGILNGTAVDCIITGCRPSGRGGAAYNSTLVRCYLSDCTRGYSSGSAMENGKMYGCVIKGLTHYGSSCVDVNCTFIGSDSAFGALQGNANFIEAYNVLLIGDNKGVQANSGGCNFHNSIITGRLADANRKDTVDAFCKVGVGEADYPYDPTTFRPLAGAYQVDVGDTGHYETLVPAAYKNEYFDFARGARIVGATIDVGAGEYSPEAERLTALSRALATDERVAVTAADAQVDVTESGSVEIPAGSSIALDWAYPIGGVGDATFAFNVWLGNGATLKILEFGEVVQEINAPGTHEIVSSYDHSFVFKAIDGAVLLSGLHNAGALTIMDENRRMSISGASVGKTDVLAGKPLVATFARTDRTQPLLTGIRVNGEFMSFSGDGADVSQTVTVTDKDDVTVEAVYEYAWYVDAENGNDDTNDGRTPYSAKQTLAAAMALVAGQAAVIHAAPGVYSNNTVRTVGSTDNRVEVPMNCGLVADEGPSVTVIEGQWADGVESGCGPDAVRCVYLKSGAWIQGFTIRKGATASLDNYGECGGGIFQSASNCLAIDCIVEDCRAVRGGGVSQGTYVRCLMRRNDAANSAKDAYDGQGYFGCVFTSGSVYGQIKKVVNCTFVDTTLQGNLGRTDVYNSYIYHDNGLCDYHHCVWRAKKSTSDSTFDDECVQTFGAAVAVDEVTYRPLATATALVDKGRNDYLADLWPSAWPAATDITGGQRIYNSTIDIGAGEYDWRPVYADRLVGRNGEMVSASSDVTEGASGIVLVDGASMTVDWTASRSGEQTFATTLTGEGELTVLLNGSPLQMNDGVYAFEAEAGSVSRLAFSFAGSGTAECLKFCGPKAGLVIMLK